MHHRLRVSFATLITAASCAAHAHGPTTCAPAPEAEWRPQMELIKKLKDDGWKVRQVKTWHGCYEVYGFDAQGDRVEAFFDPRSFERVEAVEAAKK